MWKINSLAYFVFFVFGISESFASEEQGASSRSVTIHNEKSEWYEISHNCRDGKFYDPTINIHLFFTDQKLTGDVGEEIDFFETFRLKMPIKGQFFVTDLPVSRAKHVYFFLDCVGIQIAARHGFYSLSNEKEWKSLRFRVKRSFDFLLDVNFSDSQVTLSEAGGITQNIYTNHLLPAMKQID